MAKKKKPPLYGNVGPATAGLPGTTAPPSSGTYGTVGAMSGGLPGQTAGPIVSDPGLLTPAPKPNPVQGGPHVDAAFLAQQAAANLQVSLGDTYDTYKTGQIGASYGNLDNPANDAATNPYSRAAALQESYNRAQRGGLNSYASQGQLYSGAYQNRVEADQGDFNKSLYGLKQAKQNELDALTAAKIERYGTAGATINQDQIDALLRALGAK